MAIKSYSCDISGIARLIEIGDKVVKSIHLISSDNSEHLIYQLSNCVQLTFLNDDNQVSTKLYGLDYTTREFGFCEKTASDVSKYKVDIKYRGDIPNKERLLAVRDFSYQISSIRDNSFTGCSNLSSAIFPRVKKLTSANFSHCSSLNSINIYGVESIENSTFSYTNLSGIKVESSMLKSIPDGSGHDDMLIVDKQMYENKNRNDYIKCISPTTTVISDDFCYGVRSSTGKSIIWPSPWFFNGAGAKLTDIYFKNLSCFNGKSFSGVKVLSNLYIMNNTLCSSFDEFGKRLTITNPEMTHLYSINANSTQLNFPNLTGFENGVAEDCLQIKSIYVYNDTLSSTPSGKLLLGQHGTRLMMTAKQNPDVINEVYQNPQITSFGGASFSGSFGKMKMLCCDTVKTLIGSSFYSSGLLSVILNNVDVMNGSTFYGAHTEYIKLPKITKLPNQFYATGSVTSSPAPQIDCPNLIELGESCFMNRAGTRHFDFPTVLKVGRKAFYNANAGLSSVDLRSCTSWGDQIFTNCRHMLSVISLAMSGNDMKKIYSSIGFDSASKCSCFCSDGIVCHVMSGEKYVLSVVPYV